MLNIYIYIKNKCSIKKLNCSWSTVLAELGYCSVIMRIKIHTFLHIRKSLLRQKSIIEANAKVKLNVSFNQTLKKAIVKDNKVSDP